MNTAVAAVLFAVANELAQKAKACLNYVTERSSGGNGLITEYITARLRSG